MIEDYANVLRKLINTNEGKVFELPYSFILDHTIVPPRERSEFTQTATLFQDLVIRIVTFAFAKLPAHLGRVFFSKAVALPFLRFRLLRHGHWTGDVKWREVKSKNGDGGLNGIWIAQDLEEEEKGYDVVMLYIHGGGFAMGSAWFYLEFLLAIVTMLKSQGYKRPAIFALEYSLVPDKHFPKQLEQSLMGYKYILQKSRGDASKCVLAGDSAGATLVLSLLLHLSRPLGGDPAEQSLPKPAFATLISPWSTLISPKHQNTASDFLDANQLHYYGTLYAGRSDSDNVYLSPGNCFDSDWWSEAMPFSGMFITYGSLELLAQDVRALISRLKVVGKLDVCETKSVHAWPVVLYFLGEGKEQREEGLREIITSVKSAIPV